MRNGERAWDDLKKYFEISVLPNLFDNHPPFQISPFPFFHFISAVIPPRAISPVTEPLFQALGIAGKNTSFPLENGTIQEWAEPYEEIDKGHRHISHLFALYPAAQIDYSDKELISAAEKTLLRRLENGGGHTGSAENLMKYLAVHGSTHTQNSDFSIRQTITIFW